jgi:hypothetical protein
MTFALPGEVFSVSKCNFDNFFFSILVSIDTATTQRLLPLLMMIFKSKICFREDAREIIEKKMYNYASAVECAILVKKKKLQN